MSNLPWHIINQNVLADVLESVKSGPSRSCPITNYNSRSRSDRPSLCSPEHVDCSTKKRVVPQIRASTFTSVVSVRPHLMGSTVSTRTGIPRSLGLLPSLSSTQPSFNSALRDPWPCPIDHVSLSIYLKGYN